ncbi:MAG: 3-deoxy-D-manno-octulosonic acid transferase [Phycisphaeraceae bacterium]|nr:3-deoxy-D-manno-octulosonic acid transferase [Phycisphaeraceae bacterium]
MGRGLDILYATGGLLSSPVWAFNLLRTGKWRTDWPGRFGFGQALAATSNTTSGGASGDTSGGRLMIHAVSVGEVNATAALITELQQRRPNLQIILSATTNTGHARAVQRYGDKISIVRYPFDFTGSVRRLLDRVRPDAVALMELEVWPNFVQACRQRNIPVVVINGRLTARSFRRYQRLGPMIYRAFHQVTAAGVQTQDYAQRFASLGVPDQSVTVLDTMKWDTAPAPGSVTIEGADELAADMGIDRDKPLIVAGSTGPGEEKILLEAKLPGVQLMIVPRKPERFDEVAALCPGIIRRTQPSAIRHPTSDIYLLDTMGELRKAYALADVVIVGRTFCPKERLGGSDPIEPIALGKPTVQGTDYYNFAEVVEAFLADDGIVVSDDPMSAALRLLENRERAAQLTANGQAVIARRRGATQRYADLLLKYLPPLGGRDRQGMRACMEFEAEP